jgi:hypothetical protein
MDSLTTALRQVMVYVWGMGAGVRGEAKDMMKVPEGVDLPISRFSGWGKSSPWGEAVRDGIEVKAEMVS